uniref:RecF/RecN/SMC N-terminal domain-containing protein n=1 Tax=Hemiselmis andersenii TaxID=464988 RepID=A0A6U5BUP9_HEMAN
MALADAVSLRVCKTYLVDNQRTADALKKVVTDLRLGGRLEENAPIALANMDVFEGSDVHGSEKTLMDVLEVSHPDPDVRRCITNYLIDNTRINELRLCESYDQCKANTDPTRPGKSVTLPNGVRHMPSRDSFFIERDGNVRRLWVRGRAAGSNAVRCKDLFTVDLASAQRDVKDKIEGLKRDATAAKSEVQKAEAEMQAKRKEEAAAKKLVAELGQEIGRVERKKSEEEQKEQQDGEAEAMAEVGVMDGEILRKQEAIDKAEADVLPGLVEELGKKKEAMSEADRLYREAKKDADKIEEDAQGLKRTDGEVSKGRNEAERELVKLEHKIAGKRKEMEETKKVKGTLEGELKTLLEAMSDVGERMETDRTRQQVGKEIDALTKQLDRRQRQSSRRADEVSKRYKEALHRKEHMDEVLQAYEGLADKLINSWKARKLALKRRKNGVGKVVSETFSRLLRVKNFSGELLLNHSNGTMEPLVRTAPGHEREAGAGKKKRKSDGDSDAPKTKELSGGERSISTLCLVLALAEASETPLVALDEFDVFMDEANRNASLLILCEQRRRENSQTILISPHAMASLPSGNDIHKFVMPPIDRNQRRLVLGGSSQASGV